MRSIHEVCQEVDRYFMGQSRVHEAMRAICADLNRLQIPFALAGALAANAHGHKRTTDDVGILLQPQGLARFKESRLGRGYVELFPGSKGMRITEYNVKVDVLLTGDFPGDGKPKPVSFPSPDEASEVNAEGIPVLNLSKLLELKLASGMTAPHRPQDLYDVIQLIRANGLAQNFATQLHPYVHDKFQELWELAQISEDY